MPMKADLGSTHGPSGPTRRRDVFEHVWVDTTPDVLDDGVLYLSARFNTVIHRCACGCGFHVVTPLAPKQWTLSYDGRTVSLHPSIGNDQLPCGSHYWVVRSRARWVEDDVVGGEGASSSTSPWYRRLRAWVLGNGVAREG